MKKTIGIVCAVLLAIILCALVIGEAVMYFQKGEGEEYLIASGIIVLIFVLGAGTQLINSDKNKKP